MNEKSKQIKKKDQTNKTTREDQLKKIREEEETKFVTAQEAYENNKYHFYQVALKKIQEKFDMWFGKITYHNMFVFFVCVLYILLLDGTSIN